MRLSIAKILIASMAMIVIKDASAQEVNIKAPVQEEFTPYIQKFLFKDSIKTQRLFKMDGFQVWTVQLPNQNPETVLTSKDGILIRGKIIGPDGQDISGSFTGMTAPALAGSNTPDSTALQAAQAVPASPSVQTVPQTPPQTNVQQPATAQTEPQSVPATTFDAAQASGMNDASIPVAKDLAEFRQQADDFSMWVQANKFKPGAPVLYMFADPRCPWCARSFVELKPYMDRGDIELRIIPTPILSRLSFQLAVSFIHEKNPGVAFIKHSDEIISGSPERTPMPDSEMDQKVVSSMERNVKWVRKNGIRQVPFFLYKDDKGDQVLAGALDETKIKTIVATGKTDGKGKND
nr:thioredoxin fold domain-containing protein [Brucella anthropi]